MDGHDDLEGPIQSRWFYDFNNVKDVKWTARFFFFWIYAFTTYSFWFLEAALPHL